MAFTLHLDKPIALDPGVGGCCIDAKAVRPAEIIVSTTGTGVSGVIRFSTGSVVSHALLYAGKDEVIEAIGAGVVRRPLDVSLADDKLAVAYRYPHMTSDIADAIIAFATTKVGAKYTQGGAILSTDQVLCRLVGPQPASFFCSQLVIEAYRQAGAALTELPSQCVTPEGVARIAIQRLTYVGHLKGDPAWFPVLAP